jgi:ABC-type Zn uptake system ZnuABC Zn-binding protein ZnuA
MVEDPHWWHSVDNMERATKIVMGELIKISPADEEYFINNAGNYIARLENLKKWIKIKIAELPRDKRKLVTSHDAFQYFGRDYGFAIYGVEGVSTEDEPSNKKVSEIIDTIKQEHVKAIFFESIENPKVSKAITRESGAAIGGTLYADGLGEGDAATYDGMMRHNVTTIVDALK